MALSSSSTAISLYIHIPFCREKCAYCDFFSRPSKEEELKERVIRRILEDIDTYLAAEAHPRVETVYIGGGTPNSLSAQLFAELIEGVRSRVGTPKEWTVEINPEYLSEEQLETMSAAGVDRLSIGIQSFKDEKLELIGRRTRLSDTERTLDLVSRHWRGRWSIDIMTLLPEPEGAGIETFRSSSEDDLRRALSFAPRHISLYGLTTEPGTPFFRKVKGGGILLPEEESAADIMRSLWTILADAGYIHYEISNFAAENVDMSLHNLRYWRLEPYLGIGPSAVSTLPGADRPVRMQFKADIDTYLSGSEDERIEREELSVFSFLLEHLLTGLRMDEGFSYRRLARRFGETTARRMHRSLETKLRGYERSGLIRRYSTGGMREILRGRPTRRHTFSATEDGMMILDTLLLDISAELDRLSPKKVTWPP